MDDVHLSNHTLDGFPNDAHPVLFEIGTEYNCGPIVSTALQSTFTEFKFEIPFLSSPKSKYAPLNYKQRLYESTELNSISSRLMYGLQASMAKMDMTDSTYEITFKNENFKANFSVGETNWIKGKDFSLLRPYKDIMNLWWFGRREKNVCALHKYDFDSSLLRPSAAHVKFDKSIINSLFPGNEYNVDMLSVGCPFGAVQVKINFTMTFPVKCFE